MKINKKSAKCDAIASNIINNINVDMLKWQNLMRRKNGKMLAPSKCAPKIVNEDWGNARDIADAIRREDIGFAWFLLEGKDTEVRELIGQEAYDLIWEYAKESQLVGV